ncbi:MAG: 50S ribosomal protein L4 [Polyangiales bacterium]
MKAKIKNLKNEAVGEIDLADEVFGVDVNEGLLYDVLKAQLASKRQGTAAVKNRAAVTGTRKKVYKQKGTGNARHGTKQAPLYRGGGVAHGPKVRSYAYRPTRKMRQGALCSALSLRAKEGRLTVVDSFELDAIKTKTVAGILSTLEVGTAVIIDGKDNDNLKLSVRNLQGRMVLPPEGINLYDLLRHEHIVVTKDAVGALQARFGA